MLENNNAPSELISTHCDFGFDLPTLLLLTMQLDLLRQSFSTLYTQYRVSYQMFFFCDFPTHTEIMVICGLSIVKKEHIQVQNVVWIGQNSSLLYMLLLNYFPFNSLSNQIWKVPYICNLKVVFKIQICTIHSRSLRILLKK